MRRLSPSRQPGFTLLEVLIALAILAISSMAISRQTGQSLANLQQLHLKTMAAVIADDHASQFALAEQFPGVGRSTKTIVVADLHWKIHIEISNTTEPWLRKIEVSVAPDDVMAAANEAALARVVSYRGRY